MSSDDGMTAGRMLRGAREASGLHVAALAVSLKVPVKKLEALEDDRYEALTDAVFVRALASSVCRALKIDPQPVLARLPQTAAPRLVRDSDGLNTPFRAPSDGAPPGWSAQLTRPVFLVVAALLVGVLVVILLPARQADEAAIAKPESTGQPAPAAAATDAAPVMPATFVADAPQQPPVAAAAPTPAPVASAPAGPVDGIVVFRANGPSWVEVTDAKGVVALRKVLNAGEAEAASGVLPLQVTIGRVDATEVQVRGKPFDLRAVSRDNVARFEVK